MKKPTLTHMKTVLGKALRASCPPSPYLLQCLLYSKPSDHLTTTAGETLILNHEREPFLRALPTATVHRALLLRKLQTIYATSLRGKLH